VEGPALFERGGIYYLLAGVGCCACRGGSNVEVYTGPSPMGPFTFRGDVGSNASQPFDKHSPTNYVTHAQQSKVFTVTAADGTVQYVWLGNQWVTSALPGAPRSHDLLYWAVLEFDDAGMIKQLQWQDSVSLQL
jgi:beta-xylosidase